MNEANGVEMTGMEKKKEKEKPRQLRTKRLVESSRSAESGGNVTCGGTGPAQVLVVIRGLQRLRPCRLEACGPASL